MLKAFVYGLLERPLMYRLSQSVFAPGAERFLVRVLQQAVQELPMSGVLLDIGCGPSSWLGRIGFKPVGLDICHQYSIAFRNSGGPAITGSAINLPFPGQTFDAVWSIGVLHHLPDEVAQLAVGEMMRVCRKDGVVIILDAVMPIAPWLRPIAYYVRKLDRGRFMRSQQETEALLSGRNAWAVSRFTYAFNGLEMVMAVCRKQG